MEEPENKLTGKELWMRIFNTDLEESTLAHIECKKDFEDEGTDSENAHIVNRLHGYNLSHIVDWHLQYLGTGLDSSDFRSIIEMLQIENLETIKEWD